MQYVHTIKTVVEADSREQAKAKLASELDRLEGKTGLDLIYAGDIDEYKKPTNWHEYAKEQAEEIIQDQQEKILNEYINPGIKAGKDASEIWEDIYQGVDTYDLAHQMADGTFIYNNTDSLVEAMHCIDSLSEFDDASNSGVLEGVTDYWDVINYSATYALGGAIHSALEELIKNDIDLRLEAVKAQEK